MEGRATGVLEGERTRAPTQTTRGESPPDKRKAVGLPVDPHQLHQLLEPDLAILVLVALLERFLVHLRVRVVAEEPDDPRELLPADLAAVAHDELNPASISS